MILCGFRRAFCLLFTLMMPLLSLSGCGGWIDSGEVKAYRYDMTKNCFHNDDFIFVGPYKGREANYDAPGCWIHPEKERLVYTKDMGPPYDKIREDGYVTCGFYHSDAPRDCATGERRFELGYLD